MGFPQLPGQLGEIGRRLDIQGDEPLESVLALLLEHVLVRPVDQVPDDFGGGSSGVLDHSVKPGPAIVIEPNIQPGHARDLQKKRTALIVLTGFVTD